MHDISLILLISIGFSFALLFGALTNRLGLSPIVGYLLAGVMVGPFTPGFVGDANIAAQLAELGVILLMFGVGLDSHLKDLLRVRSVVVPGAIVQTCVATALATGVAVLLGLTPQKGLVLGIAVSVASTVVLIRVLMDNGVLQTPQGHVAVGWLVVEDLFTIVVLILMPVLTRAIAAGNFAAVGVSLVWTLAKLALVIALVLGVGKRLVPMLMNAMARTRSRELFTLSVLAVALGVATGSAVIFGVSMALGAFLAGMVVGQSDVSHQAASDALPMRDAFAVLFFVSVGMLFDPAKAIANWPLTLGILGVILLGKPLAALLVVLILGHPLRTALTAAVALAQIGEFSFILGEAARDLDLLTDTGSGVLVSCAIISITLNPILFRLIPRFERWIESHPTLRRWLPISTKDDELQRLNEPADDEAPQAARALVVGYGPVGQTLTRLLRDFSIDPVIIELNVDTVRRLRAEGIRAIYGDAACQEVLESAGIAKADYLLVTLPDPIARVPVITMALGLKPSLQVLARARFIGERPGLVELGVTAVAFEEAEVAVALAELLLQEIGASASELDSRVRRIRNKLSIVRKREPATITEPTS